MERTVSYKAVHQSSLCMYVLCTLMLTGRGIPARKATAMYVYRQTALQMYEKWQRLHSRSITRLVTSIGWQSTAAQHLKLWSTNFKNSLLMDWPRDWACHDYQIAAVHASSLQLARFMTAHMWGSRDSPPILS